MMSMAGGIKWFSKSAVDVIDITFPSSTFNKVTVSHSLGVIPDFLFLYPKDKKYPAVESNTRVLQYALYTNIGLHLDTNVWSDNSYCSWKLYDNNSGAKYYQSDWASLFSNITATTVDIGGVANSGVYSGKWVLVTGKIDPAYVQGQATELT